MLDNIRNIFAWLARYIDRFIYWRTNVIETIIPAITKAIQGPNLRSNTQKKLERWLGYVDRGYELFLRYVRRLLKQQKIHHRLRKRSFLKLTYCLRHLNGLVRISKLNRQTVHGQSIAFDYNSKIGPAVGFPNFGTAGTPDAIPMLQDNSRPAPDPHLRRPRQGEVGGPGGLAGSNRVGAPNQPGKLTLSSPLTNKSQY